MKGVELNCPYRLALWVNRSLWPFNLAYVNLPVTAANQWTPFFVVVWMALPFFPRYPVTFQLTTNWCSHTFLKSPPTHPTLSGGKGMGWASDGGFWDPEPSVHWWADAVRGCSTPMSWNIWMVQGFTAVWHPGVIGQLCGFFTCYHVCVFILLFCALHQVCNTYQTCQNKIIPSRFCVFCCTGLVVLKGVLHPWPVFGLFMHFSQKLQHTGIKLDMFLIGNIPGKLITALEFYQLKWLLIWESPTSPTRFESDMTWVDNCFLFQTEVSLFRTSACKLIFGAPLGVGNMYGQTSAVWD